MICLSSCGSTSFANSGRSGAISSYLFSLMSSAMSCHRLLLCASCCSSGVIFVLGYGVKLVFYLFTPLIFCSSLLHFFINYFSDFFNCFSFYDNLVFISMYCVVNYKFHHFIVGYDIKFSGRLMCLVSLIISFSFFLAS